VGKGMELGVSGVHPANKISKRIENAFFIIIA
jgi:hypothetical protein